MAIGFIETLISKGVAPQLVMGQLERRIRGSFYVSKIGEEVRKTRDAVA